jgi:leucyl-tRNA synthetase
MHKDLAFYWIRIAALTVTPVAPHFAEHIWSGILQQPESIQLARWPTPATPVDPTIIEAGQDMRGTIKTIRDAETTLLKMMAKASKGKKLPENSFDPKKPKSVRVYVANEFPEWQNVSVQVVKDSYDAASDKVDDAQVRQLLVDNGLIKDKKVMPFIQAFKVRFSFHFSMACLCEPQISRNVCPSMALRQRSEGLFPSPRALSSTSCCRI